MISEDRMERKASDLHLKGRQPPVIRINAT